MRRSCRCNSLNDRGCSRIGNPKGEAARSLHNKRAPAHVGLAETSKSIIVLEENNMWTKPDFTEMRFGFEITMYIGNR